MDQCRERFTHSHRLTEQAKERGSTCSQIMRSVDHWRWWWSGDGDHRLWSPHHITITTHTSLAGKKGVKVNCAVRSSLLSSLPQDNNSSSSLSNSILRPRRYWLQKKTLGCSSCDHWRLASFFYEEKKNRVKKRQCNNESKQRDRGSGQQTLVTTASLIDGTDSAGEEAGGKRRQQQQLTFPFAVLQLF